MTTPDDAVELAPVAPAQVDEAGRLRAPGAESALADGQRRPVLLDDDEPPAGVGFLAWYCSRP